MKSAVSLRFGALVGVAALAFAPWACAPRGAIAPVSPAPAASSAPAPAASTLVESNGPPQEPDVVFWPTPPEVIRKMIEVADVKSTDVVYDLGSGDGRIVIATAKQRGARGYGFEIDSKLVEESREHAREAGVDPLVTFIRRDIFTVDVSAATVVMLYLLPGMLRRLEPQLKALKPGTRVVSHNFPMHGVEPDQVFNADLPGSAHTVLLWVAPLKFPAR